MQSLKLLAGFEPERIAAALEGARHAARNFQASPDEMTPASGWSHVASQALIARAPPGPPRPGGPFHRAREALVDYGFSDPRIVAAHFDPRAPLLGRVMVLELKVLGLHLLGPVAVCQVREEAREDATLFGYCIETREGHIEAGLEWFLLTQDHHSGDVRFAIEAAWRPGQFPSWWMRVGFHVLGRRYQRAWHRLAHLRLRRRARSGAPTRGLGPVQLHALRAFPVPGVEVEREGEALRSDRLALAAAVGACCGARTFLPLAMLARAAGRGPRLQGGVRAALSSPAVRLALPALALGELVADKLPGIPARTAPPALVGRVLSGAVSGAALTVQRGRTSAALAATGGLAALAGTFLTFRLRARLARSLPAPAFVAGALEDVGLALTLRWLLRAWRKERRVLTRSVALGPSSRAVHHVAGYADARS